MRYILSLIMCLALFGSYGTFAAQAKTASNLEPEPSSAMPTSDSVPGALEDQMSSRTKTDKNNVDKSFNETKTTHNLPSSDSSSMMQTTNPDTNRSESTDKNYDKNKKDDDKNNNYSGYDKKNDKAPGSEESSSDEQFFYDGE